MSINKKVVVALATGIAVAGLAGFLLGTGAGRKLTKKWKTKGDKIVDGMEGLLVDAKDKLQSFQKNMCYRCNKEEKHIPDHQEASV